MNDAAPAGPPAALPVPCAASRRVARVKRAPGKQRRLGARGVAALEFALIAPPMVLFILGTIEVTNALRVQAKVNIAAGQLASMVAAQPAVVSAAGGQADETGVLADMCTGATFDILPYYNGTLTASIASITNQSILGVVASAQDWEVDTACATTASHSGFVANLALANAPRSMLTQNGVPPASGGTLVAGYSAIVVRIAYTYTNVLPRFLSKYLTFTMVAVARPRSNSTIPCTTTPIGSASPSACAQNL